MKPDKTVTTYEYPATIDKEAQGIYVVSITPDSAGTWICRFEATGAIISAEESSFMVKPSAFY